MLLLFIGITLFTLLMMNHNADILFLYVFVAGPLLGLIIGEATNWGMDIVNWSKRLYCTFRK